MRQMTLNSTNNHDLPVSSPANMFHTCAYNCLETLSTSLLHMPRVHMQITSTSAPSTT